MGTTKVYRKKEKVDHGYSITTCPTATDICAPILKHNTVKVALYDTIRYDTIRYMRSKADMIQIDLPHGTDN